MIGFVVIGDRIMWLKRRWSEEGFYVRFLKILVFVIGMDRMNVVVVFGVFLVFG